MDGCRVNGRLRHCGAMDGLIRSVGDGITGLVAGAFAAIGVALRGIVDSLNAALPAGTLPVAIVALAFIAFWVLIRR